jgi:hypothetical protein
MIIQDSLTLDASGLALTRDGFLVGEARVSRAGNVQQYLGRELGLTGDQADQSFGVFRDPDVVFDTASMMSLAGRPVTRGHPDGGVTADNWKSLAKGQMGGIVKRDGEHVVASMAIMDVEAVQEVSGGARSLSAGYTVDVIPSVGTAADGTPYQFKQAGKLRFNHVAYLPDNNPRAGNTRVGDETRIGDRGKPDAVNQPLNHGDRHMTLKTITVDGLPVETTDAGEAAINLLRGKLADAATVLQTAKTTNDAALAAKDAELAAKDAEIATLTAKVLDAAALDVLVADRATVVSKAKALVSTFDAAGKSNADIKRAVLGDSVKDKSDAYVDAAFDLKTADLKVADPLRSAITDAAPPADLVKAHTDAKAARLSRFADSHLEAAA